MQRDKVLTDTEKTALLTHFQYCNINILHGCQSRIIRHMTHARTNQFYKTLKTQTPWASIHYCSTINFLSLPMKLPRTTTLDSNTQLPPCFVFMPKFHSRRCNHARKPSATQTFIWSTIAAPKKPQSPSKTTMP